MSEPNTPDEQPAEQHQRPVAGPDAHQEPTAAEPQPVQPEPQQSGPEQPQASYAPPPPGAPQPQVIYVQKPPGKFANFARNRVTQVVAALVVGLVVGGGIGGVIGAHHTGGPGIHRPYSQYGPQGGFGHGGFGGRQGGPQDDNSQQGEQG